MPGPRYSVRHGKSPAKVYPQAPDSPNFAPGLQKQTTVDKSLGPDYGKTSTKLVPAPRPINVPVPKKRKSKAKPAGRTNRTAAFSPDQTQTTTSPASGTTTSGRTNSTVVPHTNETNQRPPKSKSKGGSGGTPPLTYTPPSIPAGTFSSMTPQQIDAWIQTHVNADINPSIAEIRGEQTRANDLANHQATSYAGFVNAAAQLQQGIGTNVANIYGDAASRQSTFAKGFSDAFQHLESQEQRKADQLLSQNGAPAAQISQVNSQLGGGADALYALGTEPAKGLNEEGAAFGAAASFLPYATQGQGLAQLASMADAAKQTNAGFGDTIAKLEAERPGTIQKYLDFVQQQRSSEAQTRYQAQTAAQSEVDRQTQLGLERQSLGLKTQAQSFSQGVTKVKLQQEADRIGISLKNLNLRAAQAKLNQANAFAKIYGFDPATGRLTLSAQQAIKKANKQPKLTAYQAQKYKGQAMLAADRAKNGFSDDNGVQHPAIDFGDAFRRGLGTVPLNILVPALFYYYKPGERPNMTADQFLKQLRGK